MADGNKLEVRDPGTAELLLEALSWPDATVQSVADETGIAYNSVKRFKGRNLRVITERGSQKWERIIPALRKVAWAGTKRAVEAMEGASAKDAMIATGIAIEKGFLVEGRVTQNISVVHEHRHSMPGLGQALQDALAARQAPTVIEAELLDQDPD